MARGVPNEGYRIRSRLIVKRVMARAERKGWSVDKTAAVIVVSLSPARVKAGVVGPCFYCGDDFAATVDHIYALASGGADDRVNVVSACVRCNVLKHTMHVDHFLGMYPFGVDTERAQRHREACQNPEYKRLSEIQYQARLAYWAAWHGPRDPDDARWGLPPGLES